MSGVRGNVEAAYASSQSYLTSLMDQQRSNSSLQADAKFAKQKDGVRTQST